LTLAALSQEPSESPFHLYKRTLETIRQFEQKTGVSNIMYDIAIDFPQTLGNYLIEIIGETLQRQWTRVRRIDTTEIIKRDNIICHGKDGQSVMMAVVEIANLYYIGRYRSAYRGCHGWFCGSSSPWEKAARNAACRSGGRLRH
jgi:hypothetical protein